MDRRSFVASSTAALLASLSGRVHALAPPRGPYRGPNVVIIRFGGGVRRNETLDPAHSHSRYLLDELAPRGVLFPHMRIAEVEGLNTSHGEGTLNILTGKDDRYEDIEGRALGARFEAKVPTLFEYLRRAYDVPEHETLIVNGEDRVFEEFYTFSCHREFGAAHRARVLSLYRFKVYALRRKLAGRLPENERRESERELGALEDVDYREKALRGVREPELDAFWEQWRSRWGETGLLNPRGDCVLTELTRWALARLKPRLVMVNYNDCDFVHWGNASHYTRGIQIMDAGLQQIVEAVEADPFYRGNTVFAVVPDCGRNDNRYVAVPFQHHFNSASAREIFALFFGPGVARGVRVDREVQQVDVAPTLGALMGVATPHAAGEPLTEVLS